MRVTYTLETLPVNVTKSIFLAGPTQRIVAGQNYDLSWRDDALRVLAKLGYDGDVYLPLFRDAHVRDGMIEDSEFTYSEVCRWEQLAMNRADIILFWVARNDVQVGLTTNVEFGRYLETGRVVYGRPDDAVSVRYLDYHAARQNISVLNSLEAVCKAAVDRIGNGLSRSDDEVLVPLCIYKTQQFRSWYGHQKLVGNRIESFEIKSIIQFVNKKFEQGFTFGFVADVHMYIGAEDRFKINEWIFSRTALISVVAYHVDASGARSYVLTREYRTPANNTDAVVYEFVGGSDDNSNDLRSVACSELEEEIGIQVDSRRLNEVMTRQTMATFSIARVTTYTLELTDEEFAKLKQDADRGVQHGENDEERITIHIVSEKDIISKYPLDLVNLGIFYLANEHISAGISAEDNDDPYVN